MLQLYPNLTFDGRCEAAFQLYEECLGGKTVFMMRYQDTAPPDSARPPDWGNKISHATFVHADFTLHGSDALPECYQKPQGFALQINLADPVQAERIFQGLAENGTIQMPLEETFWALRFGAVVDQFGIPWAINCEKPS